MPAYLLTFVNVLGFSLLLPVLPFVVTQYGGSEMVYGLLISAYSCFQFIGAPWLGRLSDSVGRRPVLLISQGGTLLSWVVFGAAWFVPNVSVATFALPLLIIMFARILDGVTGGNHSVTQAYVSDLSNREEKSVIFGTIGGIVGIGMIIGPGLGGLLASGPLGYLGVAIGGVCVSLITLVSIQYSLKESLAVEHRKPLEKQSVVQTLRLLDRIHRLNPAPIVKRLFLVRGLFSAMMAGYVSTIALFVIDLFEFNAQELGLFLVVVGVFIAFNQAVVSKWFIRRFGEVRTMRIGLFVCALGLYAITLTDILWLYIAFYFLMNLGISLSIPTFNALIAQNAETNEMGEVMGIGDSIISLSNAVIPVFAASAYGFLGASFYHLIAVLPIIGLLLAWRMVNPAYEHESSTVESADIHDVT